MRLISSFSGIFCVVISRRCAVNATMLIRFNRFSVIAASTLNVGQSWRSFKLKVKAFSTSIFNLPGRRTAHHFKNLSILWRTNLNLFFLWLLHKNSTFNSFFPFQKILRYSAYLCFFLCVMRKTCFHPSSEKTNSPKRQIYKKPTVKIKNCVNAQKIRNTMKEKNLVLLFCDDFSICFLSWFGFDTLRS